MVKDVGYCVLDGCVGCVGEDEGRVDLDVVLWGGKVGYDGGNGGGEDC